MSKDKKRDESKEPKKITIEAEFALLGLLVAIISLIGLLNQGWLGGFLTYCLSYLFGSMYYIILLFNIYLGCFLFFKKRKPNIILGLNAIAVIFLLYFLLVASSIFDDASLSTWFNQFENNFKSIEQSSFRIDRSKISIIGGGLIGYGSYTLFATFLTDFVARLVIYIVLASCLYVLLKKPSIIVYGKIKDILLKIKDKNQNKKDEEIFDKNSKVFEAVEDFHEEDKITPIRLNFDVREKDEPTVKEEIKEHFIEPKVRKNNKNGLSFDIFNESIFDEEIDCMISEPVMETNDSAIDTVGQSIESVIEETRDIDKGYTPTYSDEELEFYGEESLEAIEEPNLSDHEEIEKSSAPFIDESVSVKQEISKSEPSPFDYEIDDIYSLLKDNAENNAHTELKDEVELNCERINQKLNELNIKASVNDYIIGPCVTRYEIVPEIGVRVSSIVNIENDLKLALAAVKTRMEAPIPGKSAVGIEVANNKRYPVYLKEVIYPFKDDESKLLVGIGRDLNNKEVVLNIDKMPHLLVAGATGSGKSVCINSMIVSLLLRTTPDEVKLILIDPKKVEMLPYANMPHLLCPVVIDPKKASMALKKVVKEMDRRYDAFASNGVRNIEGYNKLMKQTGQSLLPNIVVIIDELADLMLVAAKEVEESIQRITQLARAAGIYLVVATQRPSVDVITGVIKANIPSRIAFSVSSSIDSRTIIDRGGAEELLGKGDMLMDISGTGTLNRVQGVYVSDEEIFDVVNYVKRKYNVNFDNEFLNLEEEKQEPINNLMVNEDTNNDDKLYEDIKDFVIRNQKASTSLIQRYFTLGYARAARMMDRLEEEGVIGESNGAKPREVLMTYNNVKKEENIDE